MGNTGKRNFEAQTITIVREAGAHGAKVGEVLGGMGCRSPDLPWA